MEFAYGRVSTADQNTDHQLDAFRRAGVPEEHVYVDRTSGAKASRPQLDVLLKVLRSGDTLVITRLDRLARSLVHLVNLGEDLRKREINLVVTEQGIDTRTPEGRMLYGMLAVVAEFQRELIVANTRDGLAAARARGRKGGRKPRLTEDQAALAQRLYDEKTHTVQAIADMLSVPRGTVYGYLNRTPAVAEGAVA
jgi:DNA invertase Pin-like site-specific DNA recombinase